MIGKTSQGPRGPRAVVSRASTLRHLLLGLALLSLAAFAPRALAGTNAPVVGEIQLITIDDAADHWSGGTVMVGGQVVTIPRNLLMDLPANRLTLQQLYAEAPAACTAAGETGLAKFDSCNLTGMGGIATIHANRTNAGNVIAGDVFIEKGVESVTGVVTCISYTDGYFCLNGALNDASTGTMVRLNDPDSRHTIQRGAGCDAGSAVNCSADPRFTLDGDNYTNVFSTGYPLCIPSTVARPFPGLPAIAGLAAIPAGTAQAAADGTGDLLCPSSNRPGALVPVADSRRFAPVKLGDSLTAEGNFELVNGVRFLAAHTTAVGTALLTRNSPDQPDYLFIDEFELDAPGFQNERARSLMIGFATLAPVDILIWSLHYDPVHNGRHEQPLASVRGCDIAAGAGTCGGQGLVGAGNLIWKIRHDVDFLVGAKPRTNPCAHLQAESRFGNVTPFCPNGGALDGPAGVPEQLAILSPMPHEVQARTGHSLAFPGLVTLDINGTQATNGQYLFPFGVGLGGIGFPEMVEINLDALGTPLNFTGIPWNLDRRLSPGGCIDTNNDGIPDCEATPQPLDPFPFEGLIMDPRIQASVPQGPLGVSPINAAPLARTANRILSFIDVNGLFQGSASVLAWPPVDPAAFPVLVTPDPFLNHSPVAVGDAASTQGGTPVTIPVLANDSDPDGDALSILAVGAALHGTAAISGAAVTYTATAGFFGADAFTYTASDGKGGTATAAVVVSVLGGPATGVTVSANLPSPQARGAAVIFTAQGLGSSNYQYRFWFNNGTGWSIVQDYSTVATWALPITTPAASYLVSAEVRTSSAVARDAVSANLPFVLVNAPATGVSVAANLASPQLAGTPVVFTATGTGSAGYQYRFWFNNGVSWSVAQDWSTTATWTLAGTTPPGSYLVSAEVRTNSTVARDAVSASVPFVLGAVPAAGVTLSADLASPSTQGTPVVFTAAATGSTGYQYQFWLNQAGSWSMVQAYGPSAAYTLAGTRAAGTYLIGVEVRTSPTVVRDAVSPNFTHVLQ